MTESALPPSLLLASPLQTFARATNLRWVACQLDWFSRAILIAPLIAEGKTARSYGVQWTASARTTPWRRNWRRWRSVKTGVDEASAFRGGRKTQRVLDLAEYLRASDANLPCSAPNCEQVTSRLKVEPQIPALWRLIIEFCSESFWPIHASVDRSRFCAILRATPRRFRLVSFCRTWFRVAKKESRLLRAFAE